MRGLNELCHEHEVEVSTGGFLEYVLTQRGDAVTRYLEECRELGFDIVEISSGFVTLPVDDLVRLTKAVTQGGLETEAGGRNPVRRGRRLDQSRRSRPRGHATSVRRSSLPSATSKPART